MVEGVLEKRRYSADFIEDPGDPLALRWTRTQVRAQVLRKDDRFPMPVTALEVAEDSAGILSQPAEPTHGWRILSAQFDVDTDGVGALSEDNRVFEIRFEAEIDPSGSMGIFTGALGVPGAERALGGMLAKRKVIERAAIEIEIPPPFIDHAYLREDSGRDPFPVDSNTAEATTCRAVLRVFDGQAPGHFGEAADLLDAVYEEDGDESLPAALVEIVPVAGGFEARTARAVLGGAGQFFTGGVRLEYTGDQHPRPRNQPTSVPLEITAAGPATVEVRVTFPDTDPDGEPIVRETEIVVDGEQLDLGLAGLPSDFAGTIAWRIADGPERIREPDAGFVTEWTAAPSAWNEAERTHDVSLLLHPNPVGSPAEARRVIEAPAYATYDVAVEKAGFRPRHITISKDHPEHAELHALLRSGQVSLAVTVEAQAAGDPSLSATPVADARVAMSWSGGDDLFAEQRTDSGGAVTVSGPAGGGTRGELAVQLEIGDDLLTPLRRIQPALHRLAASCRASSLPNSAGVSTTIGGLYVPFAERVLRQICAEPEADIEKTWDTRLVALRQIVTLATYNKIFIPLFRSFRKLAEEAAANCVNWLVALTVDTLMFGISLGKGTAVAEVGQEVGEGLGKARGLVDELTGKARTLTEELARHDELGREILQHEATEQAAKRQADGLVDEIATVGKKLQTSVDEARLAREAIEAGNEELARLGARKEAAAEAVALAEKQAEEALEKVAERRIAARAAEHSRELADAAVTTLRREVDDVAADAARAQKRLAESIAELEKAAPGSSQRRVALDQMRRNREAVSKVREQLALAREQLANAKGDLTSNAAEAASLREVAESAEEAGKALRTQARDARRQVLELERQLQEQSALVRASTIDADLANGAVDVQETVLRTHREAHESALEEANTAAEKLATAASEKDGLAPLAELSREQADVAGKLKAAEKELSTWEEVSRRMESGLDELSEFFVSGVKRFGAWLPSVLPGWVVSLASGVRYVIATLIEWTWAFLKGVLGTVLGWLFRLMGRIVHASDVLIDAFGQEMTKQIGLALERSTSAVPGGAGRLAHRYLATPAGRVSFDAVSGALRGSNVTGTRIDNKGASTARKQEMARRAMDRAQRQAERVSEGFLRNVQMSMQAGIESAEALVVSSDIQAAESSLREFTKKILAHRQQEEMAAARATTAMAVDSFNQWGTWLDVINAADWFAWILAWVMRAVGLALSVTGVGFIGGATLFLMADVVDVVKDVIFFLGATLLDYIPKGCLFLMCEKLPVAAYAACFAEATHLPDPDWITQSRGQDLEAELQRRGIPPKNW